MHRIRPIPLRRPVRPTKARPMDITLHIGAHRTATTSFQRYLRENAETLARHGVGFWGPHRTRGGLFAGLLHEDRGSAISPERQYDLACQRVAMNLDRVRATGLRHLIVSDENMLGAPRRNLRKRRLYPDAGDRLSRYLGAFGGRVTRIALSVRDQEAYWRSCLAFAVHRGMDLPGDDLLQALVDQPRLWQHVIRDVARVAPEALLTVIPHEAMAGLPERRLWHLTGGELHGPSAHARVWLNRAPDVAELRKARRAKGQPTGLTALTEGPDGHWQPFDRVQQAALREDYQDDLYWLRAGAEGLAQLADAPWRAAAGHIARTTTDHMTHRPPLAGSG